MTDPLLVASYAAPALIAAATIPVILRFAKKIRASKPIKKEGLYEDKDGKATEESMANFSTKKQFIAIFVGTGIGLAASLAMTVNSFIQVMEFREPPLIWTLFACWVRQIIRMSRYIAHLR